MRNVWTQVAQISLICGLIAAIGTLSECRDSLLCEMPVSTYAILVAVVAIFITWTAWAIYIICTRRRLTPMAARGYSILDNIDCALLLCWIIVSLFPRLGGMWMSLFAATAWLASMLVAIKYRRSDNAGDVQ